MRFFQVSRHTLGLIFLVMSCATLAQTIPAEMTGIWGPSQNQWGRGDDGKNTRCEANPAIANNPSLFMDFSQTET